MLRRLRQAESITEIEPVLVRMELAVFAAAQHMLRAFQSRRSLAASRKADSSVLTILDLESQDLIRAILGSDIPVIAEEDPATHSLTTRSEFFLIDPLDGTSACKRFPGIQGGQVGYGPLVGYSRDRLLVAAVYANIPERKLYTAVRGGGAYQVSLENWSSQSRLAERQSIFCSEQRPLIESAALFYPGLKGEIPALEKLRTRLEIETTYRFGGFANDCVRLALGLEQIGIQFSLKAWDLSAALIPAEAGLRVVLDPLGQMIDLKDYQITPHCAVLISQLHSSEAVLRAIR